MDEPRNTITLALESGEIVATCSHPEGVDRYTGTRMLRTVLENYLPAIDAAGAAAILASVAAGATVVIVQDSGAGSRFERYRRTAWTLPAKYARKPHDACCTCETCEEALFRPSTAAALEGHVFDRPHAAGEHGAALTSVNRSGVKR